MTDAAITELLAKQAITEALYKYCRAMDRMDNALGKSVFHADAPADYGGMYRGTGHGFIEYVYGAHAGMLLHQHQLGNIVITLAGDRAASESYVTVSFRRKDETGAMVGMRSCGRYLDRWEKRGGHWGISDRLYLHLFDETYPVAESQFPSTGMRDRTDPSYGILLG
jgi:hypothetical protein